MGDSLRGGEEISLSLEQEEAGFKEEKFDTLALSEASVTENDQMPYFQDYRSTGVSRASGREVESRHM